MIIKENLTKVNYSPMQNKVNKYIVIHYVGAVSSAYNNSVYFKNVNRNASANYFVDENEIYRVVKDSDRAWHCGDKGIGEYKDKCTNSNSIGIEMCCYNNNGKLDISEKVIANTIELTKELMSRYNIPAENVIRHYDVTKKMCPAPFIENQARWLDFKTRLGQISAVVQPKTDENYNHKDFVKDVQKAIGAKVDGIAGPETLSKTITVSSKRNNRHAIIKPIQRYLFSIGYVEIGTADGIAGTKFDLAVKHFQKDNGCVADGEITAKNKTWKKLLKLI